MRLRRKSHGGAEEVDSQSHEISRSITPSEPKSKVQKWTETSPYFRKLNRQIPDLESPVTLRKQTTAICSNRQKIQFCKNEIFTQKLRSSFRTSSVTDESDPHISNRELTMRRASAFRASAPRHTTRGICSALSNRELLGLEVLQPVENKDRQRALIANFEPNDLLNFEACLAALRACVTTDRLGRAGLQPRRKVRNLNRALAPEADSLKFSRRPSMRPCFSLSPAALVEKLAQQEPGTK